MKIEPSVTSRMKAICIGEFEFTIDEPCPVCALELQDKYDVECLCDNSDEQTYQKTIIVPWDTCKEIYKAMALASRK